MPLRGQDDEPLPIPSTMNSKQRNSQAVELTNLRNNSNDVEEEQQQNDDTSKNSNEDDDDDDEIDNNEKPALSLATKLWNAAACITILIWFLAFGLYFQTMIVIAGAIGIIVSLIVVKQSFELEDIPTLREAQNEIRSQVNEFAGENDKLSNSNDRLEGQLGPLKDVEKKLKKIAKRNGTSIKKLQKLIQKDKKTTQKMKELVKDDIVFQMINIVLEADKDEGGDLSDKEIKILANRLAGLPAVKVNKPLLIEQVKKDRTVNAVVALMRTIHDADTLPESQRCFELDNDFDPNDLFTDD